MQIQQVTTRQAHQALLPRQVPQAKMRKGPRATMRQVL